jgi:hypothetical protein
MSIEQHCRKLMILWGAALVGVASALATPAAATASPDPQVSRIAASAHGGKIVVGRSARAVSFPIRSRVAGEGLLSLTVRAPGSDWAVTGRESAVVAVFLDDRRVTDLVIPSADPTERQIGLGPISRGPHRVTFRFDTAATPRGVNQAILSKLLLRVVDPQAQRFAVAAHAPIVIGRTVPALGSPYQNATTDVPLIAWHETGPAATAGHVVVEYSVIWSNEDGGTDTPALMARWGRTTDIEWIYRVELDEHGERVPGSDVYQAANHATLQFTGSYLGSHPVLQTCTENNNMCDRVSADAKLRFLLGTEQTRPADRAREVLMDRNPWTYPVMAAEQVREGKIEAISDPATPTVGDQRTYLWIEVDKDTGTSGGTGSAPGLSLGVRLKGDPVLYRSDHDRPDWSIARDDPAATTVELPAGTTAADLAEIVAVRQPTGVADNGAPVHVTSLNRAFFLDETYLPGRSFLAKRLDVSVTADSPTASLFTATGAGIARLRSGSGAAR